MDYLKEIKDIIVKGLPEEAMITNVDMEGPEIAIYTKNPKVFFENENKIKAIELDFRDHRNVYTIAPALEGFFLAKDGKHLFVFDEAKILEYLIR